MKQAHKDILSFLLAVIAAILLMVVLWSIGKKINCLASYEDQVKQTICEAVKAEHLKKPCK